MENEKRQKNTENVPLWAKWTIGALVGAILLQSVALYLFFGDRGMGTEGSVARREMAAEDGAGTLQEPGGLFHTAPDEWEPMREIRRMQEEMDRVFEESFGRLARREPLGDLLDPGPPSRARTDVRETEDEYLVRVDLPGVDDAEIEVTLEGSTLTIAARSKAVLEEEREGEGGVMLRQERQLGSFRRKIQLPGPVDATSLRSEYEDGVLEVRVAKAES